MAAVGIAFSMQLQRRAEAGRRVVAMSGELEKLGSRAEDAQSLRQRIESLRVQRAQVSAGLYKEREMDSYQFGTIVRDLLKREGMQISRYRTLEEPPRASLEFTVEGSALGMARFLRRVSDSERVWVVPVLSIASRGRGGEVRSVFRIGYETVSSPAR